MAVAARPELHWVLRLQRGIRPLCADSTNATFTQNLARRAMGGVDKSCGLAHDGRERDEGEPRARCVRRARGELVKALQLATQQLPSVCLVQAAIGQFDRAGVARFLSGAFLKSFAFRPLPNSN